MLARLHSGLRCVSISETVELDAELTVNRDIIRGTIKCSEVVNDITRGTLNSTHGTRLRSMRSTLNGSAARSFSR